MLGLRNVIKLYKRDAGILYFPVCSFILEIKMKNKILTHKQNYLKIFQKIISKYLINKSSKILREKYNSF